jgi:dipeptidyl aminopeptidase/acylaminoacyl peptidase
LRERRRTFRIAIATSVLAATHASAQSMPGPAFDRSPLNIPASVKVPQRSVTPMDLLTLRDPKGLSISPDGKYVAFVVGQAEYEKNAYKSAIYVVATGPGAVPKNLGSAGMPHWDEINQWIPEAPQWSPDSRSITYRMRRSGDERWQVWMWRLSSRTPEQLTHVHGDVESYEWIPEKEQVFFSVSKRTDPAEITKLTEASILYDGNFRPWESVPIAEAILRARTTPKKYWICDLRKRSERTASPAEIARLEPASGLGEKRNPSADGTKDDRTVEEGKTSPDGRHTAFLYSVRNSSGWARRLLLEYGKTGERLDLTPDSFFIDQYWWSHDGKSIYYSESDGDGHSPRLMASSIMDGSTRRVFVSPSTDYFSEFSVDASSTHIACLRERNTSPPEIVLIDQASGSVRELVNLNPEFGRFTLSPANRMEGINSFGDAWFAYFVKPLGYTPGKKYPLIVTTYRCGDYFLRGASGDESPIQVYAAQGFAVLCFDVGRTRGVTPGDFRTKVLDWSSPTASIEMAVQQLIQSSVIDPVRVGITGFSHGEEIVGYAVTHSRLFHAAVGAAGYDPSFFYIGGNVWQKMFERWGLGGWPEGAAKERWQEISLSLRADRVTVPVLENASDSEYISYLPRVIALRELGKPVELRIYPAERHVRNQPKHKHEIYERNVDWFRFWLNGDEDVSPAKAEQMSLWKKMREQDHRSQSLTDPARQ